MEIRIKTAQEAHDQHVTIEIVAADQTETADVTERLTRHDHMLNLTTDLEKRINEQARELGERADRIAQLQAGMTEQVSEKIRQRDRAQEAETKLAEQKRARQANREWAERAEARVVELEKIVDAHDRRLQAQSAKLGKIARIVNRGDVTSALAPAAPVPFQIKIIRQVIRNVRAVLNDDSSTEETSQE